MRENMYIFYQSAEYFLGAQKKRLVETVVLSTQNVLSFDWEYEKHV